MKTDIQIAQEAKMLPITDIAASLGVTEEELEQYGRFKAKINDAFLNRTKDKKNGKKSEGNCLRLRQEIPAR